jgi:hypothetical protein
MPTGDRFTEIENDISSLNRRLSNIEDYLMKDMDEKTEQRIKQTEHKHKLMDEILDKINQPTIPSIEQHEKMKRELIDITPICQAISDMTESLKNITKTNGFDTAMQNNIKEEIDKMIEILDKKVNGENK